MVIPRGRGAFNLSNYTPTDYDLAILLGKSSQQKLALILQRVFFAVPLLPLTTIFLG